MCSHQALISFPSGWKNTLCYKYVGSFYVSLQYDRTDTVYAGNKYVLSKKKFVNVAWKRKKISTLSYTFVECLPVADNLDDWLFLAGGFCLFFSYIPISQPLFQMIVFRAGFFSRDSGEQTSGQPQV